MSKPARTIESPTTDQERGDAADGVEGVGITAALLAGVAAAGEMDRPAGIHVVPAFASEELPPEIGVDTIVDANGIPVGQVGAADRLDRMATLPDEPRPVPDELIARSDTEVDEDDIDALYEAVLDEAVREEP